MATTRTYNPKTGKWEKKTTSSGSSNKNTNKNTTKKTTSSKSSVKSNSKGANKNTSKGKTTKATANQEYNLLTGTLNYIANKDTIKLCAGDTVQLNNLGPTLSGKYYVQDVTRSISSTGYTNSATLIKVDFGSSPIKAKKTTKAKTSSNTSASSSASSSNKRTYRVKKGDTLWKIAKTYYKDGSKYMKIANANNIKNPNVIKVGQVLVIP